MTVNRIMLVTLLLFLGAFHFASSKRRKCEVIKIPMCKSIDYNLTYTPNMFNHDTQEEAALEVHQYWPLVEIKCSPDLKFFLCSVYAPMCQPNSKHEVLPCRSICRRARKGCAPLLRKYGFSWPEKMRCRNFPKDRGNGLCYNGIDRPLLNHTSITERPTNSSFSPACKKINDGNLAITSGVLGGSSKPPPAFTFMLLVAIAAVGQIPV